jgi:hypothetical protein
MEGYCSTGQSPQRAVVPVEEEEEEEEEECVIPSFILVVVIPVCANGAVLAAMIYE